MGEPYTLSEYRELRRLHEDACGEPDCVSQRLYATIDHLLAAVDRWKEQAGENAAQRHLALGRVGALEAALELIARQHVHLHRWDCSCCSCIAYNALHPEE